MGSELSMDRMKRTHINWLLVKGRRFFTRKIRSHIGQNSQMPSLPCKTCLNQLSGRRRAPPIARHAALNASWSRVGALTSIALRSGVFLEATLQLPADMDAPTASCLRGHPPSAKAPCLKAAAEYLWWDLDIDLVKKWTVNRSPDVQIDTHKLGVSMAAIADHRAARWWHSVGAPSAASSVRTWRRRGSCDGAGGGQRRGWWSRSRWMSCRGHPPHGATRCPPHTPAAAARRRPQCSRRNSRTARTRTIWFDEIGSRVPKKREKPSM
jgi:hypothetical protein